MTSFNTALCLGGIILAPFTKGISLAACFIDCTNKQPAGPEPNGEATTEDDDASGDDDVETWECQHSGEEPACYFNVDFADTIAKEGEAYRLLVGLNYDIRPEQETDRLDYVIRTDRDYLQASAPLSSSSGRLCEEVFVYDNPTIEPDSAPLYLQGFQGASPDYYEAGPYTITVPPPSDVLPICDSADSALAAYQAAMANPFFLHVPIVDSTGNRLVIPEDAAYSGAFFQEGNVTLEDLQAFETATGAHPAIVVLYTDYLQGFPQTSVDSIVSFGSVPWLKVMPMDWNQPSTDVFPLEEGLVGGHDALMDEIIAGVVGTASPVLVTMAHEVNLPDFPYSRTPDVAVPYQRYFYDRAEASGAANLNGVINLNNWPFANYQGYIFAHPLVAAVAIDGYNFGVQEAPCWSSRWQTFAEVFRRPFLEAKCYSPESRILIGEFSTAPDGGDRGAYYCDAFTKIIQYPFNGFVIFSFSKNEGACGFIGWDIRE